MNRIQKMVFTLFILLALSISGCKTNISRNDDGSFTVETSITQEQLQEVISASIADPLIKELTVSLQSGYVLVSGTRARLNDPGKTDNMSFRLDLGISNGFLTASVSNAVIDNVPIEQNRLDHWNETIANRLSNIGGKNEKASLQSVSITTENVTMLWVVTK